MSEQYLVEARDLLEQLGEQISLDGEVPLQPFVMGSETFTPVGPAHVDVSITNTGAGLVASGTIDVDVTATCSRCLSDFVLPLTGQVEAFYVNSSHADELPEEQDFELIGDHAIIDVMPALRAAITVELPFAPLHDPECAGICPVCGINLNEESCECDPSSSESPFGALQGLLSDEGAE